MLKLTLKHGLQYFAQEAELLFFLHCGFGRGLQTPQRFWVAFPCGKALAIGVHGEWHNRVFQTSLFPTTFDQPCSQNASNAIVRPHGNADILWWQVSKSPQAAGNERMVKSEQLDIFLLHRHLALRGEQSLRLCILINPPEQLVSTAGKRLAFGVR